MKNKYTLSYVYQIINESEVYLKQDIISFGEESWPITRNMIWTTLTDLKKDNKIKKEFSIHQIRIKKFNFKRYKNLLINLYRNIIFRFSITKYQKNCTTLFFSRSVYLEKLCSGLLIDRIMDPIYMASSINEKSLKIYLDNPKLKDKFFLNGLNYFPNKFYFKSKFDQYEYIKLEKSCIKFLKSFIDLNSLNNIEELLVNQLKKSIKDYLISKNNSREFLEKFTSLKKIFLPSWYFPDMMGIISSAKQLDISTIEVQHGKQGKFQAAYSGWNFFPDKGFLNMPDNFWCWGKISVENILKSSPKRLFHKPILGGYAWPIWYKTFSRKHSFYEKKTKKINLLFTLQGAQGATNSQLLPDGLFELINHYQNIYNKTSIKIFEIKIRLHPNCIENNLIYLKTRLGSLFYSDLISYSSKLSGCFYDDLFWSNHHLTYFSSCAIEALIFGIKSAVYGNESYKIYKDEIENKSITYLKKNTFKELLNWFEQDNNFSSESYKDIIDIKFPDPNLIDSI